MEIVDISHNDDLTSLARKCNANFKQLAFASSQQVRKQGRESAEETAQEIGAAVEMLEETTIPNEVRSQIASLDVPGMVDSEIAALDIPGMVSDEVDARIPDAWPPIGSYVMAASAPSYPGTTWSNVGSVPISGGSSVPLWQRVS